MLLLSIKKRQTVTKTLLTNISYNSVFTFFTQNNLTTPNQSGFKTGNSGDKQLISITLEIYKSFDDDNEIREVFLDISKAFDEVWHLSLHFKLRQNDISGKLVNTLTDLLDNRTQRVILNGQYSSWAKVEVGVLELCLRNILIWFLVNIFLIVFFNLLLTCYFLYSYIWS